MVLPFTPATGTVRVVWNGPLVVHIVKFCLAKQDWVEENELVDICSDDKAELNKK